MESSSPDTVTRLLVDVREGRDEAQHALYEEVYTALRERAQAQRRRWKGEPSLQTTALAHEAYLKLVRQEEQSWSSRSHFFAVAARAMRHILINRAERHRAQKRGGEGAPLSLDELRASLEREVATAAERSEALLVLDAALDRLAEEHERAARGVECRFFGGMTIEATAEALGVSGSTVSRDWDFAQAWLYREMKRIRGGETVPDAES
jgi:RNA polymerase sigma factor (TIGR02999 family)